MVMVKRKKCDKKIKFAKGFKVPTKRTIQKALQSKNEVVKSIDSTLFLRSIDYFKSLPKPTDELDWLVTNCETGQSCDHFIQLSSFRERLNLGVNSFIYLIQIGDFENHLDFSEIVDYSQRFFSKNIIKQHSDKVNIEFERKTNGPPIVTASFGEFKSELSIRFNRKSGHYQVTTKSLNNFLYGIRPNDAHCLVGLTNLDLYVEDPDLFVAGMCNWMARVGVFTYYRYDPTISKFSEEHWYDIKRVNTSKISSTDLDRILLMRTCKLMVHEICHLLSFHHCTYMDCVMNGSGHLEEDFRQSMWLCPIDLKKLRIIIEFDIIERYKSLLQFFERHNARDETTWLQHIITSLEQQ